MESFFRVIEEKLKPPFKYFALPRGCFRGNFYTANNLRDIKHIAEEQMLKNKCAYDIMNVFYLCCEGRKGYMSQRILSLETDGEWHKAIISDDFVCLHTAFFFNENAIHRWNPAKYEKLKKQYEDNFEQEMKE